LGIWGEEGLPLYAKMIAISGFTGTLCWVGICLSQVKFRKKLVERGYVPEEVLTVKAMLYPGLAYFAIVVQIAAMILCIFEDVWVFVISLVAIFVPIAIYVMQKRAGKIRLNVVLGSDEVLFDEKFPPKKAIAE
jgi:AAT family amino acid transporter